MGAEKGEMQLGLVGWPLEHTLSPVIHEAFLESCGLSGRYRRYPVAPPELDSRLRELFDSGVLGLNVTFPHKRRAAGICSRLAAGSGRSPLPVINTMKMEEDGIITGYNTDTHGFSRCLEAYGLEEPFLVAGCGGGAMAVEKALIEAGASYSVFCRDAGSWAGTAEPLGLHMLEGELDRAPGGTLVNATTIGWSDDDLFPLAGESLSGKTFMDLNYNPSWKWRRALIEFGVRVRTGELMLVAQAAESFRIWTGIRPDEEIGMRIIGSTRESGENVGN